MLMCYVNKNLNFKAGHILSGSDKIKSNFFVFKFSKTEERNFVHSCEMRKKAATNFGMTHSTEKIENARLSLK